MIPQSFDYHRPESLGEAIGLLADLGEDAYVVAGGHSLIPMMKLRLAVPDHLIDLQAVAELKGVRDGVDVVTVGAMTTQTELISSRLLADKLPIIRETSLQIADPQIRNVGTIGGNVANGDPGNDMPAVMQALNATYVLQGPKGSREVAARDFYEAIFFTARAANEILTAVKVPLPPKGHGYAYEKQKRKIGDYATAAAAVILTMAGGRCVAASIALTNLGDTPLHAADAAAALVGTSLDAKAIDAAATAAMAIAEPVSDGRGPADYRTHVGGVMVRRAIAKARARVAS